MSKTNELLPIKVVFPREGDYQPVKTGGGDFDALSPMGKNERDALSDQIRGVRATLTAAFGAWSHLPGVAKVKLKDAALAKTKRPTAILNTDTCPVIGCDGLGELYVSVTPNGLNALNTQVQTNKTERGVAHLSTVEKIEPFSPGEGVSPLLVKPTKGTTGTARTNRLRCRLFRHDSPAVNAIIDREFLSLAVKCGVADVRDLNYADGVKVLSLPMLAPDKVARIGEFVGLQSLDPFPNYHIVRSTARAISNMTAADFPPPEVGREYPLVGQIDSGTDPNNKSLQKWVLDRLDYVPRSQQNNDHGSFVAGLLANARALNHNDSRFPDTKCRIVDVVAIDKSGEIDEFDLITVIDVAIKKWPHVRVWNLSLGLVGSVCRDHEFSLLAAALDERMKKHGVLFVIAAGNYVTPPFREWPPQSGLSDDDRISPPADAVRGLTIGGIAHIENPNTRVAVDAPSPFSRRGPGPAYVPKPELSYPSGNCDATGNYMQTGVVSLDGSGHLAENVGTSFATPLGSAVSAHVFHELDRANELASSTLTKALTLHSAFLMNAEPDANGIHYFGLRTPGEPLQIVQCMKSEATIIIQAPIRSKPEFGKRPFPMPKCLALKTGLQCEIFMTLLYDPPLDRQYGIEYCRCNVTASLGTFDRKKKKYTRQVPPVPDRVGTGYEKDLVKHGFKWSPLKLYYRKMDRGPIDKEWRLTFDLLNRAEHKATEDQDVVLIITIRGQSESVYDELVQEMARLSWGAQDLRIRSRQQLKN